MENLLRFIGPPQSDDDIDDDDDMDAHFHPHLMSIRSRNGYTNDQCYQGSYKDALMNAIDFEPDANDPRFWGACEIWDDNDEDEDEDEWVTDEERNEESCKDSKQSDASKSKGTINANASVSQTEDSGSPSLNLTLANSGLSASESKPNSIVNSIDSGGSSTSSSKLCAHCGKGGKLSMCSRCKAAFYCSKEHQQAHYPTHKWGCRQLGETQQTAALLAKKPGVKAITWEQLEHEEPIPLYGRTLEVRIISQPQSLFLRGVCEGRDSRGQVRRLAFYCKSLPKGLKKGCVLRWRNPLFHYFLDGSPGVRIEDEDLPFVTCSDN